jgi:hypothetical protein
MPKKSTNKTCQTTSGTAPKFTSLPPESSLKTPLVELFILITHFHLKGSEFLLNDVFVAHKRTSFPIRFVLWLAFEGRATGRPLQPTGLCRQRRGTSKVSRM